MNIDINIKKNILEISKENNISELLLGFRTKEFEDMIKWVVVLTYFTTR